MTWDKPMMSYGVTFQPEQLQSAWDEWLLSSPAPAYSLEARLDVQVDRMTRAAVAMRLADRMIQKARKAGAIRFVNGKWEKAE